MSYRVIGKETFIRDKVERYCDNCRNVIPIPSYPEFSLEVKKGPYEGESEYLDFCEWSCIGEYAGKKVMEVK